MEVVIKSLSTKNQKPIQTNKTAQDQMDSTQNPTSPSKEHGTPALSMGQKELSETPKLSLRSHVYSDTKNKKRHTQKRTKAQIVLKMVTFYSKAICSLATGTERTMFLNR